MSSSMTMILAAQQQLSPDPSYSGDGKIRWMLGQTRGRSVKASVAKSGRVSINSMVKGCKTCRGKGAIECPGCMEAGKNKKNRNIFERWKLKVLRLSGIWAEELSKLWQGRAHRRTKRRKINQNPSP